MRVVLDTNVILSAFLWQKKLKPIYQAIRLRKITPCFSQLTWNELQRTLTYRKFREQLLKIDITPEEITKLLASRSYFVFSPFQVTEIKSDPSDNHILACALTARAFCIVSGDKHLLELGEFDGISIILPVEFLNKLRLLNLL